MTKEEVKAMAIEAMKKYINSFAEQAAHYGLTPHEYLKSSNIYVDALIAAPSDELNEKGIWLCDYDFTYDDCNEMIYKATGDKIDISPKTRKTVAGFECWLSGSTAFKNNICVALVMEGLGK